MRRSRESPPWPASTWPCSAGRRRCRRLLCVSVICSVVCAIVRAAWQNGSQAKCAAIGGAPQLQPGEAALHTGQVAAPCGLQPPDEAASQALFHLRIPK